MLQHLPLAGQKYDLVQAWREAMAAGERLAYHEVSGHFWQDVGTPENYLAAHRRLLAGASPSLAGYFPGLTDPLIGPGARIGAGVRFWMEDQLHLAWEKPGRAMREMVDIIRRLLRGEQLGGSGPDAGTQSWRSGPSVAGSGQGGVYGL